MNDYKGKFDSVMSNIDDLEKSGVYTATSPLQQRANEVRANKVKWLSYLQGQMISQEDYDVITKLDSASPDVRAKLILSHPNQCAKTFLNLMDSIAKDQTVQYILTMMDDMLQVSPRTPSSATPASPAPQTVKYILTMMDHVLQEEKSRVEMFKDYAKKTKQSVWSPFLNMLNRPDGFIINQTARIVAKLACWGKEAMEGSDLVYFLTWLKEQLKAPNNEYIQTVARCLQMMLRIDEYRHAFVHVDGVSAIISLLAGKVGFQIQYQLTFCLWVITFNPQLADHLSKFNVTPILADILSEVVKEKVIRIILATFRNLLEKPTEKELVQDNALSMVQCKVLKHLVLLDGRKFDDPDVTDDIEYLTETLQASVQDLSSFDEYSSEIRSGRLEWSPVHKSEKFWRENAGRLNEKNYELLKILIKLLETSRDPLILSVASHDIGEYVRHYPRGKTVIEQLGGKQLVMQHLAHEDPNVRYEALLAVQKLMVHNWEYLGRQLESPASGNNTSVAAKA